MTPQPEPTCFEQWRSVMRTPRDEIVKIIETCNWHGKEAAAECLRMIASSKLVSEVEYVERRCSEPGCERVCRVPRGSIYRCEYHPPDVMDEAMHEQLLTQLKSAERRVQQLSSLLSDSRQQRQSLDKVFCEDVLAQKEIVKQLHDANKQLEATQKAHACCHADLRQLERDHKGYVERVEAKFTRVQGDREGFELVIEMRDKHVAKLEQKVKDYECQKLVTGTLVQIYGALYPNMLAGDYAHVSPTEAADDIEKLQTELEQLRAAVEEHEDNWTPERGAEAEELRRALESLQKKSDDEGLREAIGQVLDDADARDSLRFLEERDVQRAKLQTAEDMLALAEAGAGVRPWPEPSAEDKVIEAARLWCKAAPDCLEVYGPLDDALTQACEELEAAEASTVARPWPAPEAKVAYHEYMERLEQERRLLKSVGKERDEARAELAQSKEQHQLLDAKFCEVVQAKSDIVEMLDNERTAHAKARRLESALGYAENQLRLWKPMVVAAIEYHEAAGEAERNDRAEVSLDEAVQAARKLDQRMLPGPCDHPSVTTYRAGLEECDVCGKVLKQSDDVEQPSDDEDPESRPEGEIHHPSCPGRAYGCTLNCGLDSATIAHRRGWAVGTRLEGDEGYGTDRIEITALGDRALVATDAHGGEGTWMLSCRCWGQVEGDAGDKS